MKRRDFLLGVSAVAMASGLPLPRPNPIFIGIDFGKDEGTTVAYALWDGRLVLPDTNRFRYYTDAD